MIINLIFGEFSNLLYFTYKFLNKLTFLLDEKRSTNVKSKKIHYLHFNHKTNDLIVFY